VQLGLLHVAVQAGSLHESWQLGALQLVVQFGQVQFVRQFGKLQLAVQLGKRQFETHDGWVELPLPPQAGPGRTVTALSMVAELPSGFTTVRLYVPGWVMPAKNAVI
jgi:hypothetical protein